MRAISLRLLTVLGLAAVLWGCKEEKEELQVEAATDYIRLQPGKYITYRLDSTVFPQAGRATEVHSYQEKHLIDAQIADNLGRPSYRIFRFIRDTAGSGGWNAAGTYMITPLAQTVEVIEDNLRLVKLVTPIKEGTTWHSNQYLASDPYESLYKFNNDDNMADWESEVQSVGESATFGGQTVTDIITLLHQDESYNNPDTDLLTFASRTLSVDKYAKGLGLVFQEYIMWEYQPNPNPGTTGYKVGFGVKRSMIDHN
jgi:hypothetical protein